MIILIGPDGAGKSTLTTALVPSPADGIMHHCTRKTTYSNYLPLLLSEIGTGKLVVWDRFAWCEYAYSKSLCRQAMFTPKQWHNITLLTLIQWPVIVLCTHNPEGQYEQDVLPADKWDTCLDHYRQFLQNNKIGYFAYDYADMPSVHSHHHSHEFTNLLTRTEAARTEQMQWWVPMWRAGYGCIGSPQPDLLIVAERMGPNNTSLIPFETGPTGKMMTDLINELRYPLGKLAITNIVKDVRGSTRNIDAEDLKLFETELIYLNPKGVMLMGAQAKRASKVCTSLGIPYAHISHLGAYHRRGIDDIHVYAEVFKRELSTMMSVPAEYTVTEG